VLSPAKFMINLWVPAERAETCSCVRPWPQPLERLPAAWPSIEILRTNPLPQSVSCDDACGVKLNLHNAGGAPPAK
jgi:hypothetical protein